MKLDEVHRLKLKIAWLYLRIVLDVGMVVVTARILWLLWGGRIQIVISP